MGKAEVKGLVEREGWGGRRKGVNGEGLAAVSKLLTTPLGVGIRRGGKGLEEVVHPPKFIAR